MENIIDTAIGAGSFKTLVKAVKKAGLVDSLRWGGPFTVFAPNDAAFSKIPAEKLDEILENKEKLKEVLTYHVVEGKVMSYDITKLKKAKTLQGREITIDTKKRVKVNNAHVIQADIECTNGVIHVIDAVLTPILVTAGVPA